jgi:curved DNA-binding protein
VVDRKTALRGDLYLIANVILPNIDSLDLDLKKALQEKL